MSAAILYLLGVALGGFIILAIRLRNVEHHVERLLETLRQHGIYHDGL